MKSPFGCCKDAHEIKINRLWYLIFFKTFLVSDCGVVKNILFDYLHEDGTIKT